MCNTHIITYDTHAHNLKFKVKHVLMGNVSDEQILDIFSTSPYAEHENFASDSRFCIVLFFCVGFGFCIPFLVSFCLTILISKVTNRGKNKENKEQKQKKEKGKEKSEKYKKK